MLHMKNGTTNSNKKGFTLIEIMIVVLIIGLLAAMALPVFKKIASNSKTGVFAADIKMLSRAMEEYTLAEGLYPPDTSTGTYQAEFEGYISAAFYEKTTSLGGNWDTEYNDNGITSGVGVVDPTVEVQELQKVDKMIDDGNLSSGRFRSLGSGRYYWVIQD